MKKRCRSAKFAFIFILFFFFFFLIANASFDEAQYSALQSLYLHTDGENWNFQDDGPTWDFSGSDPTTDNNPCEPTPWQGLTCSSTTSDSTTVYHVSQMKLPNFGMRGTLPDIFGDLSQLTYLYLYGLVD